MAQSFACPTFLQNPLFGGKDELAGVISTKGNNIFAILRARISAATPLIISALSFVLRYIEDDLQQILKTVLDFRSSALLPAPAPAPQQYKSSYERPLKARFPGVYWDKIYLESYNFFQ